MKSVSLALAAPNGLIPWLARGGTGSYRIDRAIEASLNSYR
jgi:hypothetical protein